MVGSMGPGRFFGEVALVKQNAGRAADCLAKQRTKVSAHVWLPCMCLTLKRSWGSTKTQADCVLRSKHDVQIQHCRQDQ